MIAQRKLNSLSICRPRAAIIEDDLETQEFLREYLNFIGIQTSCFSHPFEFQMWLKKNKASLNLSLILCDVRLPQINGIDLFRASKKITKNIPFILMTAAPNENDYIESIKLGAYSYTSKPFNMAKFSQLIQSAIKDS